MKRFLAVMLAVLGLTVLVNPARSTCIPTTGPLTLQKIRYGDPGATWIGCVNESMDTLSSATLSSSADTFLDSVTFISSSGTAFMNGNVGIDTTTPAYRLDVYGDIRSTGTFYGNGAGLTNLSTTAYILPASVAFQNQANNFIASQTISGNAFSVGGSTLVVVNGNVGVDSASPAYRLDVQGDVRSTGTFYGNGSGLTNLSTAYYMLPSNVALQNSTNTFTSSQTITGVLSGYSLSLSTSIYFAGGGIRFADNTVLFSTAGLQSNGGGGNGISTSPWNTYGNVVELNPFGANTNVVVQSSLTVQGNAFSVGVSSLVVKNGNVGIGTSNPNDALLKVSNDTLTVVATGLDFPGGAVGVNTNSPLATVDINAAASGEHILLGMSNSSFASDTAIGLGGNLTPASILGIWGGNEHVLHVNSAGDDSLEIGGTPKFSVYTSSIVAAEQLCLSGTCESSWPASGGASLTTPNTFTSSQTIEAPISASTVTITGNGSLIGSGYIIQTVDCSGTPNSDYVGCPTGYNDFGGSCNSGDSATVDYDAPSSSNGTICSSGSTTCPGFSCIWGSGVFTNQTDCVMAICVKILN